MLEPPPYVYAAHFENVRTVRLFILLPECLYIPGHYVIFLLPSSTPSKPKAFTLRSEGRRGEAMRGQTMVEATLRLVRAVVCSSLGSMYSARPISADLPV